MSPAPIQELYRALTRSTTRLAARLDWDTWISSSQGCLPRGDAATPPNGLLQEAAIS